MDRPSQAPIMRRRARAEPTPRVREEQAKHQAQRQKGPKKNRRKARL
jgi:hypothetical protein